MKTSGLLGQKLGMTRIFSEDGKATAVTLVQVPDNEVFEKKEKSLVLGIFERNKYGKNENKKFKARKEFSLLEGDVKDVKKGEKITLALFLEGIKKCTVSATSKGKGFAGVIKRYNFSRGPETHGSHHHRKPGSIGACVKPGRVHRGKKLPGRMGNQRVTIRNVDIVDFDEKTNLVALKGAIPGAKKGFVELYVS